jgi:hypothetical protein
VLALAGLLGGGVFWPGASRAATLTPLEVAQEAEAGFRSVMEAWAYEEFWRLWEMGARASRAALSQGDFTERMRAGTSRPAAGKQVEAIQVIPTSPDAAVVYVRFGLEDKRRPWAESTERSFLLLLEDDRWRVSLWDFVGLANYFPSAYVPEQLLIVPPPRPPRPKERVR